MKFERRYDVAKGSTKIAKAIDKAVIEYKLTPVEVLSILAHLLTSWIDRESDRQDSDEESAKGGDAT